MGVGAWVQCGLGSVRHARQHLPADRRPHGDGDWRCLGCCRHAHPGHELPLPHEPISGGRRQLCVHPRELRTRPGIRERMVSHPHLWRHHMGERLRASPHSAYAHGLDVPIWLRLRDRGVPRVHGRGVPRHRIASRRRTRMPAPQGRRASADQHGRASAGRRQHLLHRGHEQSRRWCRPHDACLRAK